MEKTQQRKGGPLTWDDRITLLVLEMLSHRTPPSCVSANILSIAEYIFPSFKAVKELPGVSFVRGCRSVLSYLTKLLAFDRVALTDKYLELHSDGTKRRQTDFQNLVVRISHGDAAFKNVTLNSAIIPQSETSAMLVEAITKAFKEGCDILETWSEVTKRNYPNRPDLLDRIPKPTELAFEKFAKGGCMIMTDTCNTARKFRTLLINSIIAICKEEGMSNEDIKIFEGDCWHHL